jgi:hypothetical protein
MKRRAEQMEGEPFSSFREAADPIFVGVDPGRRDLITAAIRRSTGGKDDRFSLNVDAHMELSGTCYRISKERSYGLETRAWRNGMPSVSDALVTNIEYLYGPDSLLQQDMQLVNSKKMKKLRFQKFAPKQKADHQICRDLLTKAGYFDSPNCTVVILYGDARFRHHSGGYATGLGAGCFVNGLSSFPRVIVLPTNEFRTSQICSHCHAAVRMVGPGTSKDILDRSNYGPIDNPHFVRRFPTAMLGGTVMSTQQET